VQQGWVDIAKIAFVTQGIYLPLLRWSEPYFFNVCMITLKRIFRYFFCCNRQLKRYQIDHSSLLERGLFTTEVDTRLDSKDEEVSDISVIIENRADRNSLATDATDSTGVSESTDSRQDKVKMQPLFLFLASSFNVELVYCILKGITQFGYVTLCDK